MIKKFEVGKTYTGKTFLGHTCKYECIKRTEKTVTLYDELDDERLVKRIKVTNNTEYVTFSEDYMGWVEMNVYA